MGIDKNLLFVGWSIGNGVLCVKEILTAKYGMRHKGQLYSYIKSSVLLWFLNSTDSFISIYFKSWLAQHA